METLGPVKFDWTLERVMTSDELTRALIEHLLGWRVAPERFLKGGRSWEPRWRFQPLRHIENACQLLEKAGGSYTLSKAPDGTFAAQVSVNGRQGNARGATEAVALTIALARAIGIDVPDELLEPGK